MKTKNIYNLIILDESGSMSSIERQAVSAINETFQSVRNAQKQNPNQNYFISLVVFEGDGVRGVRMVRDRVPVESVQDIMQEEYRPGSCTPLYDAMGLAINHLDNVTKKEDPVLVTIITDGMENSSEEFSGKAIKELVSKKRESGWTFAYIGANQDAVEVASEMNIYNALNFDATEEGTKAMGLTLADATMRFFESAADDYDNSDDFFENIFESKKKSKKK
ncbi:MAG: VWA domain-containing protein [Rikenellaceae bacterium]|jgi:Mg-chelatase subunit ChlD|nr:VWA domain-containing protein [Rikenellaceae bacterium]